MPFALLPGPSMGNPILLDLSDVGIRHHVLFLNRTVSCSSAQLTVGQLVVIYIKSLRRITIAAVRMLSDCASREQNSSCQFETTIPFALRTRRWIYIISHTYYTCEIGSINYKKKRDLTNKITPRVSNSTLLAKAENQIGNPQHNGNESEV